MNLNPELARTTTGRVGTCPPTKNAEIDNWNHIRDYLQTGSFVVTTPHNRLHPPPQPPPRPPTPASTRYPQKKLFYSIGKKIVRM